ncbi:PAS domain S-box protein [Gemmatimonas groenlandica]|uniref:histidine kinase n=1 Tax=Gemmatimonas groenlandica TaxID=2732249 RepID=A0A6M4IUX9_9BACT|nr:PAS domain S-box protein [Gemmatimonas groenlandica]QJR37569.1 PAS domain S-box protein [Gemmatimonas groenlandica]
MRRVLYIERDPHDARALTDFVSDQQLPLIVTVAASMGAAQALLGEESFDVVLATDDLTGSATESFAEQVVIILVEAGREATATELLRAGVDDVIIKDAARSYLNTLSWRIEFVLRRTSTSRTAAEAADRESDRRFRRLLDSTGVIVWEADASSFQFTSVSENAERLSGFTSDEWCQPGFWASRVHPEDREFAVSYCAAATARLEDHEFEYRFLCRSGEQRWISDLVTVVVEASRPRWIRGLMVDITARKQAEAAHQAAARWQHALVTHAGDAIVSTDLAGNILTFNPAAERMLGYSASEMIGRTPAVFHDAEQVVERAREFSQELGEEIAPGFDVFVAKAMRQLPNRHDWTFIRKDGSHVHVSLAVTALRGASGEIEGFMGLVTDLTSRLQAESALRASEARYRTIIEAEPECVKVVSASGELLEMNRAGLAMLEADTLEDVRGRGLAEFIVPEHRAAFGALHKQAIGGVPGLVEFEIVGLHGTRRWLETHAAPLPDADGRVDKILGITRDITVRRQAVAEQAALQAQLAQAQKLESIGRLAGGVAHDFNNMLGVILGHTEMALLEVSPDQPCHLDLKEIQNAAQRSAALTRQLLAFARKQPIEPKSLDLNSTVAATLSLLQRLIGENISVNWQGSPSLWPVWMDPSQLDQILTNLCVNARDAIATEGLGSGSMTITTRNMRVDAAYCRAHPEAIPGDFVCLAVSDTGRGMEPAIIERMFEPFFTTKRLGEGTGLGLSMVDGAVRQNRGFITVHSVVNRGTTFEIFLPRYNGEARPTFTRPLENELPRGHGTILVVEDEPSILKLTSTMLRRLGYDVLVAAGPSNAIALAEAHPGPIDLLLTDVIMPEMNGSDLATAVRQRYPKLRVLFMSGYTADIIADRGVMGASVHFVQKPFTARDLQVAVEGAIADQPPVSAP